MSGRDGRAIVRSERVPGSSRCGYYSSECLTKKFEIEPEPTIERTTSEQLRQSAEQVHATRRESSVLTIRTKKRFQTRASRTKANLKLPRLLMATPIPLRAMLLIAPFQWNSQIL